jgi:hypothetical protein
MLSKLRDCDSSCHVTAPKLNMDQTRGLSGSEGTSGQQALKDPGLGFLFQMGHILKIVELQL